ncbi:MULTISPECIES: peptidoglycan-binding domain-containing protein [unclassified Streptomyces]|uniref:peptidoglycan-binding protein n=1 Tax=unclassified Streptomyces TaxID=2593676 RepID=UPI00278BB497|nr:MULTISPECIES: peptidoglycan-binding domain-containing protein [unclassified Streptomyces]
MPVPLLVGAGIVLVAGVGTVGALGLGGDDADGAGQGVPRKGQTVRVERGTLTEQKEIDGALGHGTEVPFRVRAEGTVTWLPKTGAQVRRGGAVLRVDDRPVTLLYGSLPMYRQLAVREPESESEPDSRSDAESATGPARTVTPLRGMDVKQFESNLSALGYTGFTVDEEFTELTAAAVKHWQRDLGLPQTGKVAVGDVVYAPGAVRIATTGVQVGAEATGNPVTYTSTSRMVTVQAPADDLEWARRGTRVTVELPDGKAVEAQVAQVGKDAAAPDGEGEDGATEGKDGGGAATGGATVTVVVAFDDQQAVGRLESGPVTVRHVVKQRKEVLNVPVAALVALAEGGYALEPAGRSGESGGGAADFVPVRTGLFADGLVEVSGSGVRAGMKVRIPE